jgi:hypothetical protein
MDELINLVSEKAGISESQAKTAVTTVVDYLKDKLPSPIDQQVDSVLAGGASGGSATDLTKGLGGMFGKK